MDIKKIILEEMGEFDWAKDIPLPKFYKGLKLRTPHGNVLHILRVVEPTTIEPDKMVYWRLEYYKGDNKSDEYYSDEYGKMSNFLDDGTWVPII